jgi:hypothetical protein
VRQVGGRHVGDGGRRKFRWERRGSQQ